MYQRIRSFFDFSDVNVIGRFLAILVFGAFLINMHIPSANAGFFDLDAIKNSLKSFNSQSLFAQISGSDFEIKKESNIENKTLQNSLSLVDNSLLKISAPNGGFDVADDNNRNEITTYEVQPGDTLSSIASKFNVSIDTVLWANDLANANLIRQGQFLVILPVEGVRYKVKKGDTLSKIAETYKGNIDQIIEFNELPVDGSILEGDIIIIPDGKMPITRQSTSASTQVAPKTKLVYRPALTALQDVGSYYISPTSGRNWGIKHSNNGVDIANNCGTPIYASAEGTVDSILLTKNATRFANGGYGNLIKINHPNNTVTLYSHILSAVINPGEWVNQGQLIAYMGGKPGTPGAGRSTGCHLHFEVRGAINPFIWR